MYLIHIYVNCYRPNLSRSHRSSSRVKSPASRGPGQVVCGWSRRGSRLGHVTRSCRPGHITRVTSSGMSPPAIRCHRHRRVAVRENLETICRPRRGPCIVQPPDERRFLSQIQTLSSGQTNTLISIYKDSLHSVQLRVRVIRSIFLHAQPECIQFRSPSLEPPCDLFYCSLFDRYSR